MRRAGQCPARTGALGEMSREFGGPPGEAALTRLYEGFSEIRGPPRAAARMASYDRFSEIRSQPSVGADDHIGPSIEFPGIFC